MGNKRVKMGRTYKRQKTKYAGVFHIETTTNGRADKTFYIRYKDEFLKDKELRMVNYQRVIILIFVMQKEMKYYIKLDMEKNYLKLQIDKQNLS